MASGDDPTAPAAAEAEKKEDWELQRDACKTLGDEAFRSHQFRDAIHHYSQGLTLDPTHKFLLSNRSAAHLKHDQKSKALRDAQVLVREHPEFVKGRARLAAALHALGRWRAALEEYRAVVEANPENAAARQGLQECQAKVKEQEEVEAEEEKQKEAKQDEKQPAGSSSEDDLLDDFFNQVEDAAKPPPPPNNDNDNSDNNTTKNAIRNQRTDLGSPQQQIERLLAPNYPWRNLNPFLVLDLTHEATLEDISTRYKALSLLLHPDKCRDANNHPIDKAKEAYDQVQQAKRQLLDDPNKCQHVRQLIIEGRKMGKQEWRKETSKKNDDSLLEDYQSRAVQKLFAELEYKRRQVEERERQQQQREQQQQEDELHKEKSARKFDKQWREDTRVEQRIGSWRDFKQKKRQKVNDDDDAK